MSTESFITYNDVATSESFKCRLEVAAAQLQERMDQFNRRTDDEGIPKDDLVADMLRPALGEANRFLKVFKTASSSRMSVSITFDELAQIESLIACDHLLRYADKRLSILRGQED